MWSNGPYHAPTSQHHHHQQHCYHHNRHFIHHHHHHPQNHHFHYHKGVMVLITIALRAVTKGLLYITGISPKLPCNNQAPAGSRIFNLGFSGKDFAKCKNSRIFPRWDWSENWEPPHNRKVGRNSKLPGTIMVMADCSHDH